MKVQNWSWGWIQIGDSQLGWAQSTTVTDSAITLTKSHNPAGHNTYNNASVTLDATAISQKYSTIYVVDNANQIFENVYGYASQGTLTAADLTGLGVDAADSPILIVAFVPAFFMELTVTDGTGKLSQITGAGYVKSSIPAGAFGFQTASSAMIASAKTAASSAISATTNTAMGIPIWVLILVVLVAGIIIVVLFGYTMKLRRRSG